jgi:creatinine amidohydrolase
MRRVPAGDTITAGQDRLSPGDTNQTCFGDCFLDNGGRRVLDSTLDRKIRFYEVIEMMWQELTWPELAQAAADDLLVVQPVGSIEQHGRHMPVKTDSFIIGEVARRAAGRTQNALVLPCLQYGLSWHHIDFCGAVSLSIETYIALLKDVFRCVSRHGFSTLILFNGHGGNTSAVKAASQAFLDDIPLRIVAVDYVDLIEPEAVAAVRSSPLGGMGHSGEFETSIMLYLDPDRVKPDRYTSQVRQSSLRWARKDMFADGKLTSGVKFNQISESGVLGDPTDSTPEKGETFLELAVAGFAELLHALWDLKTAGQAGETR